MVYGEGTGKTFSLELFVWEAQHRTRSKGKGILHLPKVKCHSLPPSLLSDFLEWFEVLGLDIYFFIFREVINTVEGLRKTRAKWCILFCIEWNGSGCPEKNCLFPFLGKKSIVYIFQVILKPFLSWRGGDETPLSWLWSPKSSINSYPPFFFFCSSLNFPSGLLLCCSRAASFPFCFWSKFRGTVKTSVRTNAAWGHWLNSF